jgi:hypothetical protein
MDIGLGGMAYKLVRSLEANQKVMTSVLAALSVRVEALERKTGGVEPLTKLVLP